MHKDTLLLMLLHMMHIANLVEQNNLFHKVDILLDRLNMENTLMLLIFHNPTSVDLYLALETFGMVTPSHCPHILSLKLLMTLIAP